MQVFSLTQSLKYPQTPTQNYSLHLFRLSSYHKKAIYAKIPSPKGSTYQDMYCLMKLSFQLVKSQPNLLHLTPNPIHQTIGLFISCLPIHAPYYPIVTAPIQVILSKLQIPILSLINHPILSLTSLMSPSPHLSYHIQLSLLMIPHNPLHLILQ